MFYMVYAAVTRTTSSWKCTQALPTFYLNSDVQGIVDLDHAHKVAESYGINRRWE